MKKLVLLLLTVLVCGAAMAKKNKMTNVRWCTFNIRYAAYDDIKKGVGWDTRKDRACQWVKDNNIDVVGMQEVTHKQLMDCAERLPEYDYVGAGRDDGKEKGECTPVFWRKDKYVALASGHFWLSETPEVVGSIGWDADLPRVASWVKLKDRAEGKVFLAVNTHFDHIGVKARTESAKLIMKKIEQIAGKNPAVATGDFNITDTNPAYATMVGSKFVMRDAYYMSPKHEGVRYSLHLFSALPPEKAPKIDFIFVTPQIKVLQTGIPQNNPEAELSDHNPHWADLQF